MLQIQKQNIVSVLAQIVDNPVEFFETLEKMVFETSRGLCGSAWVGTFNPKDDITQLPAANTAFFRKIIARKGESTTNGFLVTHNPVNNTIVGALFGAIDPNKLTTKLTAPNDGHIRWQAAAPPTDRLMGYIHDEGYVLEIDPAFMKLNDRAIDMQCVRTPNGYDVAILTRKGTVYRAFFTPRDIKTNTYPGFENIYDGANALLTVPRNGEAITFYGTDNGIVLNGDVLLGTQGLKVKMLVMDSERNRVFLKTDENKIYALKMDNDFRVVDKPILINDNATQVMTYDWILSGPALTADPLNPAIMLSGWTKSQDGRLYTHTRKLLHIQPGILE